MSGIPKGIYGITSERLSRGRSNFNVVEEMIKGGIKIIQYREKKKTMREKRAECLKIRETTREHNVLFIINDYIDLALLCDADGVHLGQEDQPVSEARKLIGNRLIGLSTHSPDQAREAVEAGVDYIGVGPLFETNTKEDVCDPVGLKYLDYVAKNISIPFVAIGGINEHNIKQVHDHGAGTIALVSEIVGADDIAQKIIRLKGIIGGRHAE